MNALRSFGAATALLALVLSVPTSAGAQLVAGAKRGGFHVGMSGVGSAAALGLQGDVAYNENISIGAWVDTWSYGESYSALGSTTDWSTRYFALAATGDYHFPVDSQPKLDPFLGVSVGYYVVNSTVSGNGVGGTYSGGGNRLFLGGHAGARYAFKPNVSAIGMLGVGASYLTLGLDFGL